MSADVEFFIECEDDEYKGRYAVSDKGNVMSLKTGSILKQHVNHQGYIKVSFNNRAKNKHTTRFVHRLIAKAWIPNPENKPEIDHIDRNKQNNSISNLRWATRIENNLNTNSVEFAKHYSVYYASSRPKPSKWVCLWKQNNEKNYRHFLTDAKARAFAEKNLEGNRFLQPLKPHKV